MSLTKTFKITKKQLDQLESGTHISYILPDSARTDDYTVTVIIGRQGYIATPTGVFKSKDDIKDFFNNLLNLYDDRNQRPLLDWMSKTKAL